MDENIYVQAVSNKHSVMAKQFISTETLNYTLLNG